MLFNSLTYILFMTVASLMVVFGPNWLRRTVFVVGSLLFYGFWRMDFVPLVLFTAFTDYYAGLKISQTDDQKVRKRWLVISLTMNLLVLAFFKYTYFMFDSTAGIAHLLGIEMTADLHRTINIILPLGISFYTFESMSYTIDVYRRVAPPVKNYFTFLSFVMLWPKLVAGPIFRTSEVVPQIETYRRPQRGEVVYGLEEILQGLFKKLVLADTIAPLVDAGFNVPVSRMGMLDAWTLAFLFGFQIYFDFSGYSSIALGSSRVMGFHFPRNFNWPYLATSPRDFWRRWHISLSTWIRDYLYLPLQGVVFRGTVGTGNAAKGYVKGEETVAETSQTTAGEGRRTFALFATWFIMGLWHGAGWNFALWGIWHAVLVYLERLTGGATKRLPMWFRTVGGWGWTISMCMLGWIFFRQNNWKDSLVMVGRAFDIRTIRTMSLADNTYVVTFVFMLGFLATAAAWKIGSSGLVPRPVKYAVITLAGAVMFFTVFITLRHVQSFIYFQF